MDIGAATDDTRGRVHTHQFVVMPDGKGGFERTVPDQPGASDGANAAANKRTTYIMAPRGMMRVASKTNSATILTKGDWRRYLSRAKHAFKAKQAAKKAAERAKKAKKHPQKGIGVTGTVIDQLGADNNDPLSGRQ